jgi:GNAT superfamily N-acetyltransferase
MQSDNAETVIKVSNEPSPDIAPLSEEDLPEAERIFRVAFGTFLGAPDPNVFWADRDYVYGRHGAPHVAAFGATIEGNLVGSNFATKWGSVGFFGPITVRPDLQERGIAQALLARTMEQFDAWQTRHVGLFTFPHSAKHIGLYQKYGFYARFLTAIMSAPVGGRPRTAAGWSRFSELNTAQVEIGIHDALGFVPVNRMAMLAYPMTCSTISQASKLEQDCGCWSMSHPRYVRGPQRERAALWRAAPPSAFAASFWMSVSCGSCS